MSEKNIKQDAEEQCNNRVSSLELMISNWKINTGIYEEEVGRAKKFKDKLIDSYKNKIDMINRLTND